MLNLKRLFIASTMAFPLLANAATTYVAADNSRETKLCVSAAMDSRVGFYVSYKESGKGIHYIANNIACNNLLIGEFADKAGNLANAAFLEKFQRSEGHIQIKDYVSMPQEDNNVDRVVIVRGS
ncbi:hypothetical protein [Neptunicella sp. SCSIO 80796]|uniref:hypothetical protein n=1 Tax=Neptunicella plasticusilytica TaxID=3117012 RepID=UPI003A4DCAB0